MLQCDLPSAAFGIALVFTSIAASGRCDDRGYEDLLAPPRAERSWSPRGPGVCRPVDRRWPTRRPAGLPSQRSCPAAVPSPFDGDSARDRSCWAICAARDQLAAHGITVNVDTYQFYQGVASGGIHDVGEYAGRNDYFINVDGEKAGLWKGFFITLHGETRYGDTVNPDTGAIMPVNTAELFPKATGTATALTGCEIHAGALRELRDVCRQAQHARRVQDAVHRGPRPRRLLEPRPVVSRRSWRERSPTRLWEPERPSFKNGVPVFTVMVLDTNNTPTTSGFNSLFR